MTVALTNRQRQVLRLRAAGWNNARIAAKLRTTEGVIRHDVMLMHRERIPGLTDGDEPVPGCRMIYALGLLDAGIAPADVPRYMAKLTDESC